MSTIRDTTAPLFAAAEAGHFTLPAHLTKMRAGLTALHETVEPALRTEADEHADLVAATTAAAVAGQPLPDVAAIETARLEERLAADRFDVRIKAAQGLTWQLTNAVLEAADDIIVEHLRPVFDRVVADLRTAVAVTAKYADDPVRALNAPVKERKAFADVPVLVGEYGAIAAARRVLADCGARPARDLDGEFGAVKNIDELWPRERRQYTPKPWGTGVEGTTWLLRNGAQLWLPTPAEQDARYDEVYGAREREQQRRHQRGVDMRSGFVPAPRYAQPEGSDTPPQSHPLAERLASAG